MKPYILMILLFCLCETHATAQIDSVGWRAGYNPNLLLIDLGGSFKTFLLRRTDTMSRVTAQIKATTEPQTSGGPVYYTIAPYLEKSSVSLIYTSKLQLNNAQGTTGVLEIANYSSAGPVMGPYQFFAIDTSDTVHKTLLVASQKKSLIRVEFLSLNIINGQRASTIPKILLYKDESTTPITLSDGTTPAMFEPGNIVYISASSLRVGFSGGMAAGNPARYALVGRFTVDKGWQ